VTVSPWRVPTLRRFLIVQVLLDVQLWFPVWLVFLVDLGFDLSLIGVVYGMFRTTVVVMEVPCGRLVDRLGGRRSLVLVGMATAGVHVGIATIGSTSHLVGAWLAWGVLWALASGVAPATLASLLDRHAPGADRVKVFGQARAASSAAVLVSHVAAGALLGVAPRGPFLVTAGLGLTAAVLAFGLPREPAGAVTTPSLGIGAMARMLGRDRRLASAVTAAAVVLVFGWSIRIVFQPLLLELELSKGLIGVAYLAYSGMAIVGGLSAAPVARKSVGDGIAGAMLLTWFGVVGTALAPRLGPWVFVPMIGLGFHAATALSEAWVTSAVVPGARATMLSVVGMVAGVAIAVTRPTLTWLADVHGAAEAHAAWAVVGVAGLVLLVRLRHADSVLGTSSG
jgi:hypothetical protein